MSKIKRRSMKEREQNGPSAARVRELLDYSAETGIFRWRIDATSRSKKGALAGHESLGYLAIIIDGEKFLAHRVAWLYVHGEWPSEFIDHINRNKTDNRMENLRTATKRDNESNKPATSRNSTGYKGVHWRGDAKKYRAVIRENGKRKSLGYFETAEEAARAYDEAARTIFGNFAYLNFPETDHED